MSSAASPQRRSDKELRALAKKAQARKQPSSSPSLLNLKVPALPIPPYLRAVLYLLAAATASYVSQLSLSPVYGEIPSSLYHSKIVTGVFFSAWLLKDLVKKLPFNLSPVIPVIALHTPGILHFIFRYSTEWGPVNGPMITEAITYYPVLFLSVYAAARLTELGNPLFDTVPAGISYGIFSIARTKIPELLQSHIGSTWALTRCGLHHVLGGIYAILSPSLLLLTTITAIAHSAHDNPMCVFTPALNETLALSNHSIIARHESYTGYVSVLDNQKDGYRVLRCDHSLLGGEWQRPPVGFEHLNHAGFKEPIYAVFVIMEAIRLIDPAPKNPHPRALAIGLGIGTSVDAMIKHGIETDIVELDPTVYQYAGEYFGLSSNHTAYIEDAVTFVNRESGKKKYDYILHDVFTGGAVPAQLFTVQFFQKLKDLLNEDGVIAINWAGDLKLLEVRSIIATIQKVFNNCRAFREEEMPKESEEQNIDFTNMVTFCTVSAVPYRFRDAAQSDFLNSFARKNYLFPRHEIDLKKYEGGTVIHNSDVGMLKEWQKRSAVGHWEIIRTVVPGGVWENY